jgi:hypothetical protein
LDQLLSTCIAGEKGLQVMLKGQYHCCVDSDELSSAAKFVLDNLNFLGVREMDVHALVFTTVYLINAQQRCFCPLQIISAMRVRISAPGTYYCRALFFQIADIPPPFVHDR